MRLTILAALILAVPRVALACPVCFGQSDSPMASAANLAIIVMLVIVGGVLAAFASFFIYLMRRARMAAEQTSPPVSPETARGDGGHHVGAEGTASC
jgi:hypothetical protein